ncbi:MAG: hypothetical protein ACOYYS_17985 [Chloroflexota bacterium]
MNAKTTGILASAVFLLTLIWLGQMIGVAAEYGSMESFDDALAFAKEQHGLYFSATYINALLLTLCNTLLYGSLYGLLKREHAEWAAAGLVFVPLYAILALVSYLSQLVIVPVLINQWNDPQLQPIAFAHLQHWLQIWPQSTIQLFDQFSYFLLGIPGLIYGLLMWRITSLRIPGSLFVLSSIFCLLIGIGISAGLPVLIGVPSMIGGVLSIVAVGWLAVASLRNSTYLSGLATR